MRLGWKSTKRRLLGTLKNSTREPLVKLFEYPRLLPSRDFYFITQISPQNRLYAYLVICRCWTMAGMEEGIILGNTRDGKRPLPKGCNFWERKSPLIDHEMTMYINSCLVKRGHPKRSLFCGITFLTIRQF